MTSQKQCATCHKFVIPRTQLRNGYACYFSIAQHLLWRSTQRMLSPQARSLLAPLGKLCHAPLLKSDLSRPHIIHPTILCLHSDFACIMSSAWKFTRRVVSLFGHWSFSCIVTCDDLAKFVHFMFVIFILICNT